MADIDADGTIDTVVVMAYNTMLGLSEHIEGRVGQDPADPLTRVFSSTELEDLLDWPEEFRDDEGNPIVYSAQDFVTIYNDISGQPQMEAGRFGIEVKQRSMAFLGGFNFNSILILFELTNRSDSLPDGPFTLEEAYIGFASDMDIGETFYDDISSLLDSVEVYGRDKVPLNTGFVWDSDFQEDNWTGKVGFVGTHFFQPPGNAWDGIDNDGDGIVDEDPTNGIDDDGDGIPDDIPDEVDSLDEFRFTVMRRYFYEPPFEPETDRAAYRMMRCLTEADCEENTSEAEDVRFLISSGPFDLPPGESQVVGVAVVLANPVGNPDRLDLYGDPPRPDPQDPVLSEFVATILGTKALYESGFDDHLPLKIFNTTDLDDTNDHIGPYLVSTNIIDSIPLSRNTVNYSVDGGPYGDTLMVKESGNVFTGEIPGQYFWSTVSYYIQAVDSAYYVLRDPPDAPRSTFEFSVVDVPNLEEIACAGCSTGVSIAPADYDLDGFMDIFIATANGLALFRNNGDFSFQDVTSESGIQVMDNTVGASWADYDNDGFPDLFLGVYSVGYTHILYRNSGDGTFEDVTETAGVADSLATTSGIWGDVNGDGLLDLFTAQLWTDRLYINNGDGTFEDRAEAWEIEETRNDRVASFFDKDGDSDLDLIIAGAGSGENILYENVNEERFTDVTSFSGIGQMQWNSFAVGDFDDDGDVDVLFSGGPLSLYENSTGTGHFTDVTEELGLYGAPEDASWVDLNADGLLDIVTSEPAVFIRKPGEGFMNLTEIAGISTGYEYVKYILPIDIDNDGLKDIAGINFYRNIGYLGGFSKNWIKLQLEGSLSNRSAVGARAIVYADDISTAEWVGGGGARSQDSPVLHFGLDTHEMVDSLIIDWPSGIRQKLENLTPNRLHLVVEDSTLSKIDRLDQKARLPRSYFLYQNYPNPFNPTTVITFDITGNASRNQQVLLAIYDLRGKYVNTLIDSQLEPGRHEIVWDGRNGEGERVSSGIYLYTLRCGDKTYTRKMVMVK
ncbi:MAG: FG-GAP-like repeat-containing protein [Candidatus Glassbacteria bacterium]